MASSSGSWPDALVVAFALGLIVFGAAQLLMTGTGFGVVPTCPSPTTHVDDNVDLDGGQLYQADPLGVEAQTVAGGKLSLLVHHEVHASLPRPHRVVRRCIVNLIVAHTDRIR